MSKTEIVNSASLKAIALDTGCTTTDSFVIDKKRNFTVRKAIITPKNESKGILNSISDSLGQWKTTRDEAPATPLLIPPCFRVKLNKHRVFHMEV